MRKTVKAMSHAWRGLAHSIQKERNFRIQAVSACIVIAAGFIFNLTIMEWLVVAICIALVLSMEMINTAIEHLSNIIHKEFHPAIRIIKDVSAGAVLVSALCAFICGAVIFIPKIISFINSI